MSRSTAPSARFPAYIPISMAVMVAAQLLAYYVTHLALPYLTAHVLTGTLDAYIPCSPPWVIVYCLSFPFWLVTGLWVLSDGKPCAYRFSAAYVLAMVLSAAVFLLWPGTMARPSLTGDGLFERALRCIYRIDSPTNLCPSLHVLATWFCLRGALIRRGTPRWYKIFCFVFFLLVCCSVLLVKQHALIDVPVGVAVGELALQGARILRLERIPFAIEKKIRKEQAK
jgi:membrane-associated phospholipid phosphatase